MNSLTTSRLQDVKSLLSRETRFIMKGLCRADHFGS
uniref:Uncharacterized protein n=1 Tax=Timema cristinae TaxID=61476 RepID=A0A7R9HDH9_TIMCR|nr:unnamed protein product [Timema cristinae]